MNKQMILSFGMLFLLLSSVTAIRTDFFYSPDCPHCKEVFPIIQKASKTFPINLIDISKGSYNLPGVPLIKIKTSDCRDVYLIGSQEIPKSLMCELNEMTTKECPTYSTIEGYNKNTQSWFIR